jgi:hypothetical protein
MMRELFTFEFQTEMSEEDYRAGQSSGLPRSRRSWILLTAATILGIAAMFSLRTMAVGVVVLTLCTFAWTYPRWSRNFAGKDYWSRRYLHGPLTYGISDQKLWFRGRHLYSESTWEGLSVWEEKDGVLRLHANGMPELFLPIDILRNAGVYDKVRECINGHGLEFDSPAARRMNPFARPTDRKA